MWSALVPAMAVLPSAAIDLSQLNDLAITQGPAAKQALISATTFGSDSEMVKAAFSGGLSDRPGMAGYAISATMMAALPAIALATKAAAHVADFFKSAEKKMGLGDLIGSKPGERLMASGHSFVPAVAGATPASYRAPSPEDLERERQGHAFVPAVAEPTAANYKSPSPEDIERDSAMTFDSPVDDPRGP